MLSKGPGHPCDHIRARRLDLELEQKDVAPLLGVSVFTLLNWELNKRDQNFWSYPRIMEFLGYCPVHYPKTLGERLRLLRTHRGLSILDLANILGIDPSTLGNWERDVRYPMGCPSKYLERIVELPLD